MWEPPAQISHISSQYNYLQLISETITFTLRQRDTTHSAMRHLRQPATPATLALLAFVPVLPYAILGYAGQDLPFHLSSWLDLRDAWITGRLAPGWSAAANLGLGDPHLTLYPPISLYLGGLLALLLPLRLVPAAFVYLCALVSGLTMHRAGGYFLHEEDRLPAAAVYMLSPYLVATALVRFAAAELLVLAWLPLFLLCFHQTLWPPGPEAEPASSRLRPGILLAVLLALTWLTDIPAAIVLFYALLASGLVCAWLQRSPAPILRLALANALAAALAAFYLAPAFAERHWISAAALIAAEPGQLLLFIPPSGLPTAVRHSPLLFACWLFLCVEALLLVPALNRLRTPLQIGRRARSPRVSFLRSGPSTTALSPAAARTATLATLALAAVLFQLPLAYPLWRYLPELPFVQFPFRFLAVLGAALPLLLFAPQPEASHRARRTAGSCLALGSLSLIALLGYLSMTGLSHRRIPPLAAFAARGTTAPEYLPAGTSPPTPPLSLDAAQPIASIPGDTPACAAKATQHSPNLRAFRTHASAPCRIRIALFDYPYWRAFDESLHPLHTARDPNGLLLVDIPAGDHLVAVSFHPASRVRTASALLSILAATFAAVILLARPPRPAA